MPTSKRYFDVGDLGATDASALADALRGKTWAEFQR
jgi:hypothetical protein